MSFFPRMRFDMPPFAIRLAWLTTACLFGCADSATHYFDEKSHASKCESSTLNQWDDKFPRTIVAPLNAVKSANVSFITLQQYIDSGGSLRALFDVFRQIGDLHSIKVPEDITKKCDFHFTWVAVFNGYSPAGVVSLAPRPESDDESYDWWSRQADKESYIYLKYFALAELFLQKIDTRGRPVAPWLLARGFLDSIRVGLTAEPPKHYTKAHWVTPDDEKSIRAKAFYQQKAAARPVVEKLQPTREGDEALYVQFEFEFDDKHFGTLFAEYRKQYPAQLP